MSVAMTAVVRCAKCGKEVEICEGCQEPDCVSVVCYRCMNRLLGQSWPDPRAHGS